MVISKTPPNVQDAMFPYLIIGSIATIAEMLTTGIVVHQHIRLDIGTAMDARAYSMRMTLPLI